MNYYFKVLNGLSAWDLPIAPYKITLLFQLDLIIWDRLACLFFLWDFFVFAPLDKMKGLKCTKIF